MKKENNLKTILLIQFILFVCFVNTISSQILVPYKSDTLFGYSNIHGEVVIKPTFDKVSHFNKLKHAIVQKSSRYYLIDQKGAIINIKGGLKFESEGFDKLWWCDSYYTFHHDKTVGIIDSTLNHVFATEARYIYLTKDHKYIKLSHKRSDSIYSSIIDLEGNPIVTELKGSIHSHFSEDKDSMIFFSAEEDDTCSLFSPSGELLIKRKSNKIDLSFYKTDSIIIFQSGNEFYIYDKDFDLVVKNSEPRSFTNPNFFRQFSKLQINLLPVLSYLFDQTENTNCFYNKIYNKCICVQNQNVKIYSDGKLIIPQHMDYIWADNEKGIFYYQDKK